jgi:hypothetical protein
MRLGDKAGSTAYVLLVAGQSFGVCGRHGAEGQLLQS